MIVVRKTHPTSEIISERIECWAIDISTKQALNNRNQSISYGRK